ncbi:MAG: HAMP domain-containing histidine kinase [Anaerolineaceae bacterium]|nr:HAMP domain-containing histidine kinase [Anaerolineaceae bacterium]
MSKPSEILQNLFPVIENRVVLELTRGSLLKDEIADQFQSFYKHLLQALETGDPSWFDPLLNEWANSLTQSDLEDESIIINDFITQLVVIINQTIVENSKAEQSVQLITILLPIYAYLFNKTANIETSQKIQYLSKQVEKAKSDLAKLDESKSNFVAVAAHELKTPLTLIDGYTSMLIDVILKQNNNDLLVFTNGILNGSKRLRGIIEDMIDVSLLENNLLDLNYQPYWLNRILEFVLLELSPVCKERDISINIHDFDGYKLMNYGDSERLIQLFKNLIINAIKFTPDGGIISINGRKLSGFIEVLISDTGIGINQEDQAIIFEKFNRLGNIALHSSSKTKFKGGGPGLGLPIAKGIAEAHGGSIWVESSGYSETDFPGSTFHTLLPLFDNLPENSK